MQEIEIKSRAYDVIYNGRNVGDARFKICR